MVMDRSSVTVPKPPKRNVIRIKVRLLLCARLPADVSCCVPSRGPRGCASPLRARGLARARGGAGSGRVCGRCPLGPDAVRTASLGCRLSAWGRPALASRA